MGLQSGDIEPQLPRLARYALRLTKNPDRAQDLVQDTVVRALEKAHLYRDGNVAGWLVTLMHNTFVNGRRQQIARGYDISLDDAPEPTLEADQDRRALVARDLDRALSTITPNQRLVILTVLRIGQCNAAADHLGLARGTLLSRLSRGRDVMRRALPGYQL